MCVYLLIEGTGADGDERRVEGVYASRQLAEAARLEYPQILRSSLFIEEWPVIEK